jgi:hypothetical protein
VPIPKNCEKHSAWAAAARFAGQELGGFATSHVATFTTPGALVRQVAVREYRGMIGKLMGAWLGEKVAGRNEGAKGAMLGYGAAALARRSVPTLAAVAGAGWLLKKWRDKRRARASYPSDATPSSPPA